MLEESTRLQTRDLQDTMLGTVSELEHVQREMRSQATEPEWSMMGDAIDKARASARALDSLLALRDETDGGCPRCGDRGMVAPGRACACRGGL